MLKFWNSKEGFKKRKEFSLKFSGKANPNFGNDKLTGKKNPAWKDKIETYCYFCKKKIEMTPQKHKLYSMHFCNKNCWINWMKNIRNISLNLNPNWRGGASFEPYPLGWNKTFKEQIRYRDKYTCQLCGVPEVECRRKLGIHHIDYNKENILEDNLITLCHSCHAKTNGNRKHWKEYFYGFLQKKSECRTFNYLLLRNSNKR